jgi:hypothetical protein
MKQRLVVAVFTIIVFCAGYFAGVWREQKRPLPPPPGPAGAEFTRPRQPDSSTPWRDRPINRADLVKQIESLKPQLDDFRSRMTVIESGFSHDFDQLLTPEQRARHEERAKRRPSGPKESGPPLTDDEVGSLRFEQPAHTLLTEVVIAIRLDGLTRDYRLDDAQREKVRALLKERRDKVIALIDSSPSPTVSLIRLAPYVQRLAQPASAPQVPAAPNTAANGTKP